MKYFCRSCNKISHYKITKVDGEWSEFWGYPLHVSYDVDTCPKCGSDNLEEIREHGYLLKTSKSVRIIYDDEDLIDWIHTLGKCEIEEF